MTQALLAGALAVVFVYLALEEWELVRHGRFMRRSLLGRPERRRPSITPRAVWAGLNAGELPLRAIQGAALATLASFVIGLALRSLTLSLLSAVAAIAVGYAWTQRRRWTLAARVDRQLTGAMSVMASSVAAGSSLFQALEAAATETAPPLGELLRRAAQRVQLGATVEEALRGIAAEVRSRDVSNLVAALAIQRITGGDIARLLRETTAFLQEEQRLRGDARALSAQARYSAQMIGVMPAGLFALFYAMFPSFIEPLTTTTLGIAILAYCLFSSAFGFYLIWRIATGIERI